MQNGQIIISILVSITVISLLIFLIIYILISYKKNHNNFVKELETINSNYEKELLATQLEIQEHTFLHIAQELHDNVGQIISLANLSISRLCVINNQQIKDNAELAMRLLERSLEEIRHISKNLNPETIRSLGLVNAVSNELKELEKTGCFKASLNLTGKSCCLNDEKEIVLFRIVQESLNNIIKHSKAKHVQILFHYGEKNLYLSINDNGIGFSVSEKLKSGTLTQSSGLQNIIRRSKIIDATYSIKSEVNLGTSINIKTPFK